MPRRKLTKPRSPATGDSGAPDALQLEQAAALTPPEALEAPAERRGRSAARRTQ